MRREKITELLRHNFSDSELISRSASFAAAYRRLTDAKEEKKSAVAQFSERIATEEAVIGKLSREISQGWETRPIECKIIYHLPNTGFKTILRCDTEAIVKEVQMDKDEMQDTLFQDPLPFSDEEQRAKIIEANVRSFFNMKPAKPSDADPIEVHGWTNQGWLVVAASEAFAQQWMETKGHAEGLELSGWTWADPDSTVITGPQAVNFFERESLPLRAAITHMENEGIEFPMLLEIPAGYMEKLQAGLNPDAKPEPTVESDATDQAQDNPAPKPRRPRTRKAKPGETIEPGVPNDDQSSVDEERGSTDSTDEDGDASSEAGDSDDDNLEPSTF